MPEAYRVSLAKIEAQEAEQAAANKAEQKARQEAVQAQIAAAVEAAITEERAMAAGKAAASAEGGNVAPNVDWGAVPSTDLTLIYPGQASFEWVQNGKQHGGARPLTKGGDSCMTCHAAELEAIGTKIVAGGDLEPTPIPGKRGTIDATIQAAHDANNLYVRIEWPDAGHHPAPFVEGGKMDPDNRIKVAMMIAGNDIEMGETTGCWSSCHADNAYMPFDPGAETIQGNAEVAGQLEAGKAITKYLSESRTKIEIRGRRGKAQGGWDKLKTPEEIDELLAAGTYLDLLRVFEDGTASNGYLLERRVVNDGEMAAEANLSAGVWTVVFSRPLNSGAPGDVPIEAGKTYTVGFAIHDDYAAARFHHVTLNTSLALSDETAQINAVAQ
ncbi:ethylbenzene dehydrogenase-related protein [Oricola sp.]|uniref:ethylbenzene dehydrogenase-related protein n=1 Tax=Oricola sp. TaxID=1979950 RepID=UPI003BAB3F1A